MKTYVVPTLFLLVTTGVLFFSSCKNPDTGGEPPAVPAVNVTVQPVTVQPFADDFTVFGAVKAFEDVMVSPEEGGVVKQWKKRRGERVNKGDLIVILKDEVVKASYEAAEAQLKMAEITVEKQRSVYEQNGISELQYKNLVYGRDAAKANADLMKARWERTQLRSPIDGFVEQTFPNEGEMAPPGMPIFRVVNTSTIKIQAEIPELYIGSIAVGTAARVTFDAVPDESLSGTVTFVGSTVSAANRTMQIEILLPNPRRRIKPEMVATVRLVRRTAADAILIGEHLVQLVDRDRSVVFTERNGIAEERNVKIGGRRGNLVEIISGLKAGDRLIVSGFQKLINGTPVVVTP